MSDKDNTPITVSATYKDLSFHENAIRLFLIDAVLNKQFTIIPLRHVVGGIKEDTGEDEPVVIVPGVGGEEWEAIEALKELYNSEVLDTLIFQYTGCGTEVMVRFITGEAA